MLFCLVHYPHCRKQTKGFMFALLLFAIPAADAIARVTEFRFHSDDGEQGGPNQPACDTEAKS
ncbi:MAG: hypothetical protein KGQ89_05785 [Verrucomicrobia bacterium]|nr:hypothetical protein [Verrucomicrobiota bacterium]